MICNDQHLKQVFKNPPLVAFKRQRNLKDNLIRAKVANPPALRSKRKNPGMKNCGKMCTACPFVKQGRHINNKQNPIWKINKNVNCETSNIIYLIECTKCKERYIGETKRSLRARLADHRGYVNNQRVDVATGAHFNKPGHGLSNLSITIIEKQKNENDQYRKEREKYFINKFNTHYKGMNKNNGG